MKQGAVMYKEDRGQFTTRNAIFSSPVRVVFVIRCHITWNATAHPNCIVKPLTCEPRPVPPRGLRSEERNKLPAAGTQQHDGPLLQMTVGFDICINATRRLPSAASFCPSIMIHKTYP